MWIFPSAFDFIKFQNMSDFKQHGFATISVKKNDPLETKFQIGGLHLALVSLFIQTFLFFHAAKRL